MQPFNIIVFLILFPLMLCLASLVTRQPSVSRIAADRQTPFSGDRLRVIHEAIDYGVVKMNIDTDLSAVGTTVFKG